MGDKTTPDISERKEEPKEVLSKSGEDTLKIGGTRNQDDTREAITLTLLCAIIGLVFIPIILFVVFPPLINKEIIELIKWAVGILTPLLGTAIGFYFGGKMSKDK